MTFRVWWYEEFKDCKNDDERYDIAWTVPDRQSILYPERSTPCEDVDDAVQQYAEYFHDQRDGYENTWPLQFVVHDGELYYLVEVDREYEPSFYVNETKGLTVP